MKIVSESPAKLIKKLLARTQCLKLILGMAWSEVDWKLNFLSTFLLVQSYIQMMLGQQPLCKTSTQRISFSYTV